MDCGSADRVASRQTHRWRRLDLSNDGLQMEDEGYKTDIAIFACETFGCTATSGSAEQAIDDPEIE